MGFGPRGLGALEALAARLPDGGDPVGIDIFETSTAPGAGPNFHPEESEVCRLNIPLRDIDIRPPGESRCGAFSDWMPDATDPNSFPARSELGRYLEARYADLRANPSLLVTPHAVQVDRVTREEGGWFLFSGQASHGPYAEVLLAVGQPETRPDDQLAEWRQSSGTLVAAYPARLLERRAAEWTGQSVAIRGLALSAFDVIRVLTVAQGGHFREGAYVPSGREPKRILPFSLNGHPPYPKPETGALDRRFTPTASETAVFLAEMKQASATSSPAEAREQIHRALVPTIRRLQEEIGKGEDEDAIVAWLEAEWKAPSSQEGGRPWDMLQEGISMADGTQRPSIGYSVGQVWRKWQDEIRRSYNPVETPPATAEALIGFDEGLKRYSYGPPVASSRELVALVEAGIVDLELSEDPEIDLAESGWVLKSGGQEATAEVMIDAVLPSPELSSVGDPLVSALASDGVLGAVAEGLGVRTRPDGTLVNLEEEESTGLAFLGRLALGSVIAVDSLHDCFGQASHRWAEGVIQRL